MATKANRSDLFQLQFNLTGSTRLVVFSNVRNWSVRAERKVINATNNDSSGWRELAGVGLNYTNANSRNLGQLSWSLECEAVYDVSTAGPGGVTDRSQARDRKQVMRNLVDGVTMTALEASFGKPGPSTSIIGWGFVTGLAAITGYVEHVEVGGTYDAPVLYGLTIRGSGAAYEI